MVGDYGRYCDEDRVQSEMVRMRDAAQALADKVCRVFLESGVSVLPIGLVAPLKSTCWDALVDGPEMAEYMDAHQEHARLVGRQDLLRAGAFEWYAG